MLLRPAATKLLAAALLAMLVEVDAATSLVSFGEALLVKLITDTLDCVSEYAPPLPPRS